MKRHDPTSKRSDAWTAAIAAAHLAFTYAPVYLAAANRPGLSLVVFWAWFGAGQNGLINLMHECAHRLAFRSAAANEFLGQRVLAPLVITDFLEYRERHWEHHRKLGTAKDPKLVYRTDIRGFGLLRLAIRALAGVEAIRRLTERPIESSGEAKAKVANAWRPLVPTQALFLASVFGVAFLTHEGILAVLVAGTLAYGFVYAYGLASVTVFAAAIRAIAEHQVGGDCPATEGSAALRNLRCNPITRLVLGAYGFGEHATHHAHPNVPYYRLPALTFDLARSDAALVPGPGYLGTLARLASQRASRGQRAWRNLR
jgi:fatty acid desaturase